MSKHEPRIIAADASVNPIIANNVKVDDIQSHQQKQQITGVNAGEKLTGLHKAARTYARHGMAIFPCISLEQGRQLPKGERKKPICPGGHRAASTNVETIDRWWTANPDANIGFDPHSCDWSVIDIEAGGELANLPDTYTIATPNDGEHRYFDGELPSSVRKLGPKVDTRGSGTGYVLLPPSKIAVDLPNGGTEDRPYKLLRNIEVEPVPQWIVDALKPRAKPQAVASHVELDTRANLSRAVARLQNMTPAVEKAGADARTYEAACEMKDLGTSEDKAVELMLEHYKCQPQDHRFEAFIQRKVANAYRYGTNAAGAHAAQSGSKAFGNVMLEGKAKPAVAGPIPFSEVLARTVKPVQEIIPGLVERGLATMLAGPGGVHKSRVALQWGLSIASGTAIYGRTVQQATFVHLSYEDHVDEVTRRAQAITQRLNLPMDAPAYYWNLKSVGEPLAKVTDEAIETTPFFDQVRDYLRSIPGHKFVVSDSTYNVLQFIGQAKINEPAVKGAINFLDKLCEETDSTMLFLWHPSQAGQERGDASGWSVAWHNTPRARLSLTAVADTDGAYDLKVEKRNNGPSKGKPLTLYWADGVLLPMSEVDAGQQSSLFLEACIAVAVVAAKDGHPITKQRKFYDWEVDEIARTAGFRPKQPAIKGELARAVSLGRLRYVDGYGKKKAGYFPVEADIDGQMPPELRAK